MVPVFPIAFLYLISLFSMVRYVVGRDFGERHVVGIYLHFYSGWSGVRLPYVLRKGAF